jgi:hypothetical protein
MLQSYSSIRSTQDLMEMRNIPTSESVITRRHLQWYAMNSSNFIVSSITKTQAPIVAVFIITRVVDSCVWATGASVASRKNFSSTGSKCILNKATKSQTYATTNISITRMDFLSWRIDIVNQYFFVAKNHKRRIILQYYNCSCGL